MTPVVRTENLSKSYRTGSDTVRALEGVTFCIEAGESVAVMGPSGSGKSTLMNLLGLLDRPSRGRYWIEGEDVSAFKPDKQAATRNRKVGFVFQASNLLARSTALENVELPMVYAGVGTSERRRRAGEALEAVGLGHRQSHWPHQLSGGEQQRVAIARAMVNDPLIILADEPTGALDSRTGLTILALFQTLNHAGRTLILVTHDALVARHAGRIINLRDGLLISDEPVAERLDAAGELSARNQDEASDAA
jgi:putative ABC transport system ATP-binding protein